MRLTLLEERLAALRHEIEERRSTDFEARAIRSETIEKRLLDLNGEAGRLKTILASSVPLDRFNAYVESEREKAHIREAAVREKFDAYRDEMGKWRATINTKIASWSAGLGVLLAMLQVLFHFVGWGSGASK